MAAPAARSRPAGWFGRAGADVPDSDATTSSPTAAATPCLPQDCGASSPLLAEAAPSTIASAPSFNGDSDSSVAFHSGDEKRDDLAVRCRTGAEDTDSAAELAINASRGEHSGVAEAATDLSVFRRSCGPHRAGVMALP